MAPSAPAIARQTMAGPRGGRPDASDAPVASTAPAGSAAGAGAGSSSSFAFGLLLLAALVGGAPLSRRLRLIADLDRSTALVAFAERPG
jgi:hypothetical protein